MQTLVLVNLQASLQAPITSAVNGSLINLARPSHFLVRGLGSALRVLARDERHVPP